VPQGVGPEFKPLHCKKKKKSQILHPDALVCQEFYSLLLSLPLDSFWFFFFFFFFSLGQQNFSGVVILNQIKEP
jgi:hypothetical protein